MTRQRTRNIDASRLPAALLEQDRNRRSSRAAIVQAQSHAPPLRNDLLPAIELVHRDPKDLRLPQRNVRRVEQAHVQEVLRSIDTLGFVHPPLIDQSDTLIDGVVRVEAARQRGLTSIPCLVIHQPTEADLKLTRLALNRLQEKGAFDLAELKLEIEELILVDAPIEIVGFDQTAMDMILLDPDAAPLEEGPVELRAEVQATVQLGDVLCLGPHRVVCGDARDEALLRRVLGGTTVQLVLTDQPYNKQIAGHVTRGAHREFAMASGEMSSAEFDAFNTAWMAAVLTSLTEGGLLTTFIDWGGLHSVTSAALGLGLSQLNLIVWGKTNAGMGSLYRSQHELLPLFKKGENRHTNNVALGRKGRHRSNLWSYPGASSLGSDARRGLQHHPTVKPVAMLVDALHDLTDRGDAVLDPFLGSGSTLIAAEKAGRICYGVEIDPLYVDLIARRYTELTKRAVTFQATGETFADAVERKRTEAAARAAPPLPRVRTRAR